MPERKGVLERRICPRFEIAAASYELDHRHQRWRGDEQREDYRGERSAGFSRAHEKVNDCQPRAVRHRRRKSGERVRERDQRHCPERRPLSICSPPNNPQQRGIESSRIRRLPQPAHGNRARRCEDDRPHRRRPLAEAFFAKPQVSEEKCDGELEKNDSGVNPAERQEQRRQKSERR